MADNNENKVLNVPHLRFPEFSGEWEEHTLSEYLEFKNGLNPDAKRIGSGLPFISVMDILSEGVINYDNIRGKVNATEKEIECFGVKDGDLLFQRSSETLEDVGRANVYMDNRTAIYGGFVIRGRKIGNYDPLFFKYLLATPLARKRTCRMGAGAQHFNIGQEGLSKISLYFPSIEEQRKIAEFLSLIDERIATQNKIIEDLKLLKSAIIEEHYKQSEKQCVLIADLGEPFSVGNLSKDDLTDTGTPCVIYGELFTTYREIISHVESYTNKSDGMTFSKKGDLLFPSSTTVDAVSLITPSAINIDNVVLGGDMFGIHINSDYNAQYLSYYFNHIAKKQFAKYAKGSTIIHLHYKDIEKNKLLLPCLIEQNKTANNLISLDEKIKIESSYLQSVIKQKTYLLRQMFI